MATNGPIPAFSTDYMEKSFAGFPRSYPDGMEDADVDAIGLFTRRFYLGQRLGAWQDLARLRRVRHHRQGLEGPITQRRAQISRLLSGFRNGTTDDSTQLPPGSRIASALSEHQHGRLGHGRAGCFSGRPIYQGPQRFEKKGEMPELHHHLPAQRSYQRHRRGAPTPAAQVADNDLAFGQIVEAISHSRFWKDTCIFAIEDDPQAAGIM